MRALGQAHVAPEVNVVSAQMMSHSEGGDRFKQAPYFSVALDVAQVKSMDPK